MTTTTVRVRSYAHAVTYVADNILRSLQDIVRMSGLDPSQIANDWNVLNRGISTWMSDKHLEAVILEVYAAASDELVGRWDVDIVYEYSSDNGTFYVDTDAIRYAIKKAGMVPATCRYRVVVTRLNGAVNVDGWVNTELRSTAGFVRQSVGTAVSASGVGGGLAYYRRG
jgi:hypothetical protein